MPTTRQLAAIMFTDIQGFTAMMQHDEELAVKIRDGHRKIFNGPTEKYNGKIEVGGQVNEGAVFRVILPIAS